MSVNYRYPQAVSGMRIMKSDGTFAVVHAAVGRESKAFTAEWFAKHAPEAVLYGYQINRLFGTLFGPHQVPGKPAYDTHILYAWNGAFYPMRGLLDKNKLVELGFSEDFAENLVAEHAAKIKERYPDLYEYYIEQKA
jgi:hypothetical protein